jgi:integrase
VKRRLRMASSWVAQLKPAAVPVEYRDEEQRGLVLRVETSGRRAWVARYTLNGRRRRYTIGAFPEVSLKAARAAARRVIGSVEANGADPQLERERLRVGENVAGAVDSWLADSKVGPASRWKAGLDGGTARSFLPHVRRFRREWGSRCLPELTPKDVERFVSAPEAAATRNRALTALRLFFAWAVRKGLVTRDPSAGLSKERETERSRVLSNAELCVLIRGFDSGPYGRAVRLLALTGLRRDEVLGAKWAWFDADAQVLTIPPEAEKTGRGRGEPRRVALSAQAVALLADQRAAMFAAGRFDRDGYIFATDDALTRPVAWALQRTLNELRGLRANGQASDKPAALAADATLHDLRRTIADALLNRLHAAPWVVDHVVLGHVRPKLLRTYMPNLPLDEARAALTLWADHLSRILDSEVSESLGDGRA